LVLRRNADWDDSIENNTTDTIFPQISFVGQIRNVSTQSTNITYRLDDGTGVVDVKQWVDTDTVNAMDTGEGKPQLLENSYARVWGRLKAFNGKRHVGAHIIRPITDMNEVQYHLLQATFVHLYYTRGPPEQFTNPGQNDNSKGLFVQDNAGGNTGGMGQAKPLPAMSNSARRIIKALTDADSNEGLHIQHLATQLGMPMNDVLKAGDELLGMSSIYTTVDDETWALLDY
jgi:replication factor A2